MKACTACGVRFAPKEAHHEHCLPCFKAGRDREAYDEGWQRGFEAGFKAGQRHEREEQR